MWFFNFKKRQTSPGVNSVKSPLHVWENEGGNPPPSQQDPRAKAKMSKK